jgi:hypothetical protein
VTSTPVLQPTAAPPTALQIPAGSEVLPFSGTSSSFNTLGEFNHLMQSAIAGGDLDSFWEAVVATGQMPLIFGENLAVFLYRGQADRVQSRGDFKSDDLRQDESDLWALIKQFEPDARLEYHLLLNTDTSSLDLLNPLTELGGRGVTSVVRMPAYVFPEFTSRDDINTVPSADLTISSQVLNYDVNYRIYTCRVRNAR